MSSAHDRVRAYLNVAVNPKAARETKTDHVSTREDFVTGERFSITLADLRIVMMQAEALEHVAPAAARIIEHTILDSGS